MKGGEPGPAGIGSDQSLDPLPHLLRRLVGERHRQDLVGPGVPAPDEIGDPIGNDARFARASACENEQRPVAVQHGVALFRIQLLEEIHDRVERIKYTVRWSAGPLVRWSAGPLVRWFAGPLVRWSAGSLVRWSAGSLVRGPVVGGTNGRRIAHQPRTTTLAPHR